MSAILKLISVRPRPLLLHCGIDFINPPALDRPTYEAETLQQVSALLRISFRPALLARVTLGFACRRRFDKTAPAATREGLVIPSLECRQQCKRQPGVQTALRSEASARHLSSMSLGSTDWSPWKAPRNRPVSVDLGAGVAEQQKKPGIYKTSSGTFMYQSTSFSAALDNLSYYPLVRLLPS